MYGFSGIILSVARQKSVHESLCGKVLKKRDGAIRPFLLYNIDVAHFHSIQSVVMALWSNAGAAVGVHSDL